MTWPGRTASRSWPGPAGPGPGGVKSAAGLPFRGQVPERSAAGTREVHGLRYAPAPIRLGGTPGRGEPGMATVTTGSAPAGRPTRSPRRQAGRPALHPGSPGGHRRGTPAQRLTAGQQVPGRPSRASRGAARRQLKPGAPLRPGQVAAQTLIASRPGSRKPGIHVPLRASVPPPGPAWRVPATTSGSGLIGAAAGGMGRTGRQPAGFSGSGRRPPPSLQGFSEDVISAQSCCHLESSGALPAVRGSGDFPWHVLRLRGSGASGRLVR